MHKRLNFSLPFFILQNMLGNLETVIETNATAMISSFEPVVSYNPGKHLGRFLHGKKKERNSTLPYKGYRTG